jgi:hypothetical protein
MIFSIFEFSSWLLTATAFSLRKRCSGALLDMILYLHTHIYIYKGSRKRQGGNLFRVMCSVFIFTHLHAWFWIENHLYLMTFFQTHSAFHKSPSTAPILGSKETCRASKIFSAAKENPMLMMSQPT